MSFRESGGGYCGQTEQSGIRVRRRALSAQRINGRCQRQHTHLEPVLASPGAREDPSRLLHARGQVRFVAVVDVIHLRFARLRRQGGALSAGLLLRAVGERECFPNSAAAWLRSSARRAGAPQRPWPKQSPPTTRTQRQRRAWWRLALLPHRGAVVLGVKAWHLGLQDTVLDRRRDDVLLHRSPVRRHGGQPLAATTLLPTSSVSCAEVAAATTHVRGTTPRAPLPSGRLQRAEPLSGSGLGLRLKREAN
jgi:hypothetical protein